MGRRKTGIEIAEELKKGWSKWEDKYLREVEREVGENSFS
jgi:hypothetical protein